MRRSFDDCSRHGFWFCSGCRKVTEPDEQKEHARFCVLCGGPGIKWCEPVIECECEICTESKLQRGEPAQVALC